MDHFKEELVFEYDDGKFASEEVRSSHVTDDSYFRMSDNDKKEDLLQNLLHYAQDNRSMIVHVLKKMNEMQDKVTEMERMHCIRITLLARSILFLHKQSPFKKESNDDLNEKGGLKTENSLENNSNSFANHLNLQTDCDYQPWSKRSHSTSLFKHIMRFQSKANSNCKTPKKLREPIITLKANLSPETSDKPDNSTIREHASVFENPVVHESELKPNVTSQSKTLLDSHYDSTTDNSINNTPMYKHFYQTSASVLKLESENVASSSNAVVFNRSILIRGREDDRSYSKVADSEQLMSKREKLKNSQANNKAVAGSFRVSNKFAHSEDPSNNVYANHRMLSKKSSSKKSGSLLEKLRRKLDKKRSRSFKTNDKIRHSPIYSNNERVDVVLETGEVTVQKGKSENEIKPCEESSSIGSSEDFRCDPRQFQRADSQQKYSPCLRKLPLLPTLQDFSPTSEDCTPCDDVTSFNTAVTPASENESLPPVPPKSWEYFVCSKSLPNCEIGSGQNDDNDHEMDDDNDDNNNDDDDDDEDEDDFVEFAEAVQNLSQRNRQGVLFFNKCQPDKNCSSVASENRFVLDEVIEKQAEIEQLEKGPKVASSPASNRPGVSNHGDFSPNSAYDPATPHRGQYFSDNRPTQATSPYKIMTAEEIAEHEAEAKLRKKLQNEEEIKRQLALQQKEAKENDEWLKGHEMKLGKVDENPDADIPPYHTAAEVRKLRELSKSARETPRSPPNTDIIAPPPPTLNYEEVRPTPTMKLDRENDLVYRDTMNVVKAAIQSNQQIMGSTADDIFVLVKNIGAALKTLCSNISQELNTLPSEYHREIDMAQKTTNKDLFQIINQTKLIKKFYVTTQVNEYKKSLMAANQVLAMDVKNLLDAVDKARINNLQS